MRFLFLCCGSLLLAIAYQLGASRAIADGSSTVTPTPVAFVDIGITNRGVVDDSGQFHWQDLAGSWHPTVAHAPPGRPVTVFMSRRNSGGNDVFSWIVMANGDAYSFPRAMPANEPVEFTYEGNVFSTSVNAQGTSLGGVKSRYR